VIRTYASAVLFLVYLQCACTRDRDSRASPSSTSENSVAAFLKNAERQSETDEQRKEIQQGLRDMLDKPLDELRHTRYSDYEGVPKKWSITQLLSHFFVPNPPAALDEERFYQDVRAPAAREAIQRQLDAVSRAR
jgi:hypothetical protein